MIFTKHENKNQQKSFIILFTWNDSVVKQGRSFYYYYNIYYTRMNLKQIIELYNEKVDELNQKTEKFNKKIDEINQQLKELISNAQNNSKEYIERKRKKLEQKKKEVENRISFALQAGKFEEAKKYCDDLEQIINQM